MSTYRYRDLPRMQSDSSKISPAYAAHLQRKEKVSIVTAFVRWLQLKQYQYEVTFSLYMLTPTEKLCFNLILFVLMSLFVAAVGFYLPNHVTVVYNRVLYYVQGSTATSTVADAIKTTKAALAASSVEVMTEPTIGDILNEL